MSNEEKLRFLLEYHKNLTEQMKSVEFFRFGNWKTETTMSRLRKCEAEINRLLGLL